MGPAARHSIPLWGLGLGLARKTIVPRGGGLRVDSDSEEVGDDDKGYFSDTGTGTNITRRWAANMQPPLPSPSQSSPDKSVESVKTGVDDMDTVGTKSPSHNSTASKEESEMGLEDVVTAGKEQFKTSVTGDRRKREGKTMTSSPANNTRASKKLFK